MMGYLCNTLHVYAFFGCVFDRNKSGSSGIRAVIKTLDIAA